MTDKTKERLGRYSFTAAAAVCVIAVSAVFVFLIYNSIPAFKKIGILDLLFGEDWSPDRLDTFDSPLSGSYGIFTMIVGTLCATAASLLIGGSLGYFTAVFLVFYCPKRLCGILKTVINLLAGIPSVIYGFFGIAFLLPLLSNIAPNNGSGLLAVSLILGIMILPTVVSLSRTSLEAVPRAYYEGSVAMGATHTETVFRVMSPAARSGIFASLILGIGRALGETMAVVMIAGNAPTYPRGLFSSFRVLTANIVMEMGYAGEVQASALVATGVVLLLFVLAVNLIFAAISRRISNSAREGGKIRPHKATHRKRIKNTAADILRGLKAPSLGRVAALLSGVTVSLSLLLVIGFILVRGIPPLIGEPSLIYGKYQFGSDRITVLPAIVSTLYIVAVSLAIAVPIGIMTAVYLNEYTKRENRTVRAVRTAIDILAGVPSIVYGLFGMMTFVRLLGGSSSILAGALTVSIMLLPVVIRSVEESLRTVDDSLRAGSLALGAGKVRTVFKIVLPSALSGIVSAVILSIGRVISESAPFLYTAGSVISALPRGLLDSGATLSVALYQLSGEGWHISEAYATAVVLIVTVLLLNGAAELCEKRMNKRLQGGKNVK